MARDVAAVRARVGDDEPCPDMARRPSPFLRDVRDEAAAAIGGREKLADVDELGLQLDDEERCLTRIPTDEIDGSAFAKVVERDLGMDLPAAPRDEPGYSLCHR